MPLKLYNTLTRAKREFRPIDPQNVRMYVCGPTVYDFAHIGNARPVIVFDLLYRLLRHEYGAAHVKYVRNITDVDDKINARALRDFPDLPLNDAIAKVTSATAAQFHKDVAALGCLPPNVEPRATQYIGPMIEVIEKLIARGHAYNAYGYVMFSAPSMNTYGRLSRRKFDQMIAGARIDGHDYKRNDADFVLWKPARDGEPGWDSPWGRGRPGWHIECSAMSWKNLGETFDIHGGGLDLIFPHHENEIAQSTCAFGHDMMANVWMHNGFVQVEGRKMSKSDGNFVTIRELTEQWTGDALRLNMLKTHYRSPIDWTHENLSNSNREFYSWADKIYSSVENKLPEYDSSKVDPDLIKALYDDLNTQEAFTILRNLHESKSKQDLMSFIASLQFLGFKNINKPGFFQQGFTAHLHESGSQISHGGEAHIQIEKFKYATANGYTTEADNYKLEAESAHFILQINDAGMLFVGNKTSGTTNLEAESNKKINSIISRRLAARAAKNWAESDRIRDELLAQGIVLKDNKDGTTTWKR
jgi:cysteinyl-tRNA synthetase